MQSIYTKFVSYIIIIITEYRGILLHKNKKRRFIICFRVVLIIIFVFGF